MAQPGPEPPHPLVVEVDVTQLGLVVAADHAGQPSQVDGHPVVAGRGTVDDLRPWVLAAVVDVGVRHVRTAGGVTAAGRTRGQKLPRFSCSRSIASNSALKLPMPKPSEPCRSISSKKTVGRSPSGLVKICSR